MVKRTKNAGLAVPKPETECDDINCPFHGTLKIRGKQFTGVVVSSKMQKSVSVEWGDKIFIPKYERYKKTKTKVIAHNPDCIGAVEGDQVKIIECRPLSKTKNFVVVQVIGKENLYALDKELQKEGRHKEKAKETANKQRMQEQDGENNTQPSEVENTEEFN